jgi:hypothetical protein
MPRPRTLPMHPPYASISERKAFAVWLGSRRKRGLPLGCYGLWKWLAPIAQAKGLEVIRTMAKEAGRISAANNRKRPAWCSKRLWKAWRGYQREVCAGIPLEVYADPLQRMEWKAKAGIRSRGTRRQRVEELLMRKGLHPSQRRAA